MQANLDGSNEGVFRIYDDYWYPHAKLIRCDGRGEVIYVLEVTPSELHPIIKRIWIESPQPYDPRALLPPTVQKTSPLVHSMALDVSDRSAYYVYWTTHDAIKRCRTDGGDEATIMKTYGAIQNWGIAVDLSEFMMYWSDNAGIYRATMEGQQVELIYPNVLAKVVVVP